MYLEPRDRNQPVSFDGLVSLQADLTGNELCAGFNRKGGALIGMFFSHYILCHIRCCTNDREVSVK